MKQFLKGVIEQAFSIRIYSSQPHGRDDCHDIARSGVQVQTIFDVGANDGGSAKRFCHAFPDATIYSFEPVASTFQLLLDTSRRISGERVVPIQVGLGASTAMVPIFIHPAYPAMNSLVATETPSPRTELVQITTVDLFVAENNISRIDFLKIDTEGFDLEVLKGATTQLNQQAIQLVLAEVSLDALSSRHVPFESIRDFLRPFGFSVFGIYAQQPDWSGRKRLQYANALFALDIG